MNNTDTEIKIISVFFFQWDRAQNKAKLQKNIYVTESGKF